MAACRCRSPEWPPTPPDCRRLPSHIPLKNLWPRSQNHLSGRAHQHERRRRELGGGAVPLLEGYLLDGCFLACLAKSQESCDAKLGMRAAPTATQEKKKKKRTIAGYIYEILSELLFLHQDFFFFYHNTADKKRRINKRQQFGVIKKPHLKVLSSLPVALMSSHLSSSVADPAEDMSITRCQRIMGKGRGRVDGTRFSSFKG